MSEQLQIPALVALSFSIFLRQFPHLLSLAQTASSMAKFLFLLISLLMWANFRVKKEREKILMLLSCNQKSAN